MRRNRSLVMMAFMVGLGRAACGDPDTPEESASVGTSEEDSTSVGTSEEDSAPEEGACIGSLSGEVSRNGVEEMAAGIAVCRGVGACFEPFETEADGSFVWEYPHKNDDACTVIDFKTEWLHIEIFPLSDSDNFANYAFTVGSLQEDISDEGAHDLDLHLGRLAVYELPEASATYSPEDGADVDLEGITFVLPGGGIVKRPLGIDEDVPVENPQEIRVFKAPLDEWDPPFVDDPPDALYYLSPHWAKIPTPGVRLSIEPPEGWRDGDTGRVELLGRWATHFAVNEGPISSEYMYRTDEGLCINTDDTDSYDRMYDGFMADCGEAEVVDGRIVTSPLPRFSWVALYR